MYPSCAFYLYRVLSLCAISNTRQACMHVVNIRGGRQPKKRLKYENGIKTEPKTPKRTTFRPLRHSPSAAVSQLAWPNFIAP